MTNPGHTSKYSRAPAHVPFAPRTRSGRGGSGTYAWMITFTDLIALMLTFFVLLYSMSQVNQEHWENMVQSLAQDFNSISKSEKKKSAVELHLPEKAVVPGANLDYLAPLLQEQIAGHAILAPGMVWRLPDRLVISLPDTLIYRPKTDDLAPQAEAAVFALSGVLRNLGNEIEIEVYSDLTPPRRRFRSNWELTLSRSTVLTGMLSAAGYEWPIVARGYGNSRHAQPPAGWTAEQRKTFANRIDVVIHEWARVER
ncbi:MAG: flagellar motor protein MotB [Kiloniellales bacterium]